MEGAWKQAYADQNKSCRGVAAYKPVFVVGVNVLVRSVQAYN